MAIGGVIALGIFVLYHQIEFYFYYLKRQREERELYRKYGVKGRRRWFRR
jgi:hypothetical protein